MAPFVVDVVAIISLFVGMPGIIVAGIVVSKMTKNRRFELDLREREIALEERRLALDEQAYHQALLETPET